MTQQLFGEECLEALTYERSKKWSTFLKFTEENDDNRELEISDLEELFEDENEESMVETAEAQEEEVEDDIKNTTACMSKAELTLMLCSGDNKEILNQTLPIIDEHVRKWKEAGLNRILDTFDTQKIEKHVGDWLRRHNSAYGDKTPLQTSPVKAWSKRCKTTEQFLLQDSPDGSNDSEAESMHSMETARYIRASRKRTVSISSKCNNSPLTTIKMYRTLPRKRDELRAKYGYNDEQEHRHHMQALLYRRDQLHRRRRERENPCHTGPRRYPYSVASTYNGQQRRKQLRKRRDSSPHISSPSSSESDHEHGRCDCSACTRRAFSKTVYPYCAYRSYHSHSQSRKDCRHQRLELTSRSMHSMIHFQRSVHQLRRQHTYEEDLRPRLVENECTCCNNDRLCSNVVHIANSSTEEWLVENRSSPDPVKFDSPKICTRSSSVKNMQQKFNKINNKIQSSSEGETDEEQLNVGTKPKPILNLRQAKKSKGSVTFSNLDTTHKNKPIVEEFKTPVKGKITKQTNTPQKIPNNAIAAQSTTKSNKKALSKNIVKNSKGKLAMNKKAASELENSDDSQELRRAIALSKQTYIDEQKRLREQVNRTDQSPLREQSMFNNHSVACNSTALNNDTACNRALNPKPLVAGGSLKQLSNIFNDSLASNNNSDQDADCTVVTSTTGFEALSSRISEQTVVQRSQRSDVKLTSKGILLYAPSKDAISKNGEQSSNISSGVYTLTEHSLSPIIGQRRARQFLKYHMGSRSFDRRYSVYYRPSAKLTAVLKDNTKSVCLDISSSSSGSDLDIFERVQRYGEIYSALEK